MVTTFLQPSGKMWKADSDRRDRTSKTQMLLILGEEFFGVLDTGRRNVAAQEPGQFIDAFGGVQTYDPGEGAGLGDAFGHLKMRRSAGSDSEGVSREAASSGEHAYARDPDAPATVSRRGDAAGVGEYHAGSWRGDWRRKTRHRASRRTRGNGQPSFCERGPARLASARSRALTAQWRGRWNADG